MAMQRSKEKVRQMTANDILNHMVDGRVADTCEIADRELIMRQVEITLGVSQRRTPARIR
jgi:hypothetical protein